MLLDRLDAARVTAFDLDPAMVEKSERRLRARGHAVSLSVGDTWEIEQPTASVDAVVEFGVIHHVPEWPTAISEIARVLRPGGLVLFEEVPRHTLDRWVLRTLTTHPRENRFAADEFVDELAPHALIPLAATSRRTSHETQHPGPDPCTRERAIRPKHDPVGRVQH